jgi:hypothetical protein
MESKPLPVSPQARVRKKSEEPKFLAENNKFVSYGYLIFA